MVISRTSPVLRFAGNATCADVRCGGAACAVVLAGSRSHSGGASINRWAATVFRPVKRLQETVVTRVKINKIVISWETSKGRTAKMNELEGEAETRREPKRFPMPDHKAMNE